jgi:hypothetical protein
MNFDDCLAALENIKTLFTPFNTAGRRGRRGGVLEAPSINKSLKNVPNQKRMPNVKICK